MFLYQVGNGYFDTLAKTYISGRELEQKKRYLLDGNQIEILDNFRNTVGKDEMYVVLTMTTLCNLSCEYCFENTTIRHSMTYDTVKEVLENIKSYIKENNITRLNCNLFGGEPLLEEKLVSYVSSELYAFCILENVDLNISMTTNGLICNKALLEYLYKHSVKTVQITFDGPKEINNSRRRATSLVSEDPYTTIFENLNTFLSIFDRVNIKYNFDKQNYMMFDIFLSDLLKNVDKLNLNKIVILVEAIQETHQSNYAYHYKNTDRELALAYISILSKLIDLKIKYKSKIFNTPCMATAPNSFLIDPDGKASCCISNFKDNELSLGKFSNMTRATSIEAREKLSRKEILNSHCQKCEFLAACWGGCLYELSVGGKDITKVVNCRRAFYECVVNAFYEEIYLKRGVNKID